jgi:hypothetical protein
VLLTIDLPDVKDEKIELVDTKVCIFFVVAESFLL